jgi:hypothetical protein
MSDRPLQAMSDERLGAALAAASVAWPATPEVADAVGRRIARTPAAGRGPSPQLLAMSRRRKIVLLAAAAVLALATAAGAARLIWDLGAVVVRFDPSPSLPPITFPPEDGLGTPVSVAQAERIAGLDAPTSTWLGPPDQVWVDAADVAGLTTRRVTLAWSPRTHLPAIDGTPWGAVVTVFQGEVEVAAKSVPSEPTGRFTQIHHLPFVAYWIDAPHVLTLLGDDGPQDYTVRGRVLLWEREPGVVIRFETALRKGSAVRLALSFHPRPTGP